MIKLKKLTLTLALLIMAAGGAWAQSSLNVVELEVPAGWETDYNNVTAADLPGFSASTLEKAQAWTGAPAEGAAVLFYAFDGEGASYVSFEKGVYKYEATFPFQKILAFNQKSQTKFYYTAEITEWSLTPDETGKKWTLDKMPASNVELQVEYFAESNLFLSKEALADAANIAVKAGDLGVQFGNDGKSANTITEGSAMTVKFNGTKKVLGMKVAKKSLLSIKITGPTNATIYYFEGETWEQAIQNHPTENSAWEVSISGAIYSKGYALYAGDNLVDSNDKIDPKANYRFPLS